ncbi:MAG: heme-copper oxidase subunit III [Anaerolineales bacterium]|nr:heme-copper oxidase subunit III [Anaerolineales bacterium]
MTQSLDAHPASPGEGIHLPKPSITPLLLGLGIGLLAFGALLYFILDFPWVMPVGIVVIVVGVGGWLVGNIRERVHGSETPAVAAKFAMWCFLGTEVVIFGALIARVVTIWLHDPEAHRILTEPITSLLLVSVNTFLLLVSSLAVVLGLNNIQAGKRGGLLVWLAVTAVLGATFVGIQGYEYSKLVSEGVTFGANQFSSAFYILTGNHGLHVIIGVIWCTVLIVRGLTRGVTTQDSLGVEIFGLYWHFVDVVWILIFTLVYLI